MTSRQEMQEQETFVFEARVFRRVIYRQEKTVQVLSLIHISEPTRPY